MKVRELNRAQLNELKQTYACQLRDCGEDEEVMGITYQELVDASLIPDEVMFEHYDGIEFVEDDFFCGKEDEVKEDIETVLRVMCAGRSREWSEGMVDRIYNTDVIYDNCVEDCVAVNVDMIVSALMEIVYKDCEV